MRNFSGFWTGIHALFKRWSSFTNQKHFIIWYCQVWLHKLWPLSCDQMSILMRKLLFWTVLKTWRLRFIVCSLRWVWYHTGFTFVMKVTWKETILTKSTFLSSFVWLSQISPLLTNCINSWLNDLLSSK